MNEDQDKNLETSINNNSNSQGLLNVLGLFFLELIKVVLMAGITIWVIRYFFFRPFYVQGQSMIPTFEQREYLLIDEVSYRFREPLRGEVIVFRAPVAEKEFYLKRVVGLPGERVKIADQKVIIYNDKNPQGVVLDENYLVEDTTGSVTYTLGPDQFFVLGDNRDASFDSRQFGPIEREAIVGRTWVRGWPINRISTFSAPDYNI